MTNRSLVVDAAKRVRRYFETFDASRVWFPRECCQIASRLLAKYLVDMFGISGIEGIANGKRVVLAGKRKQRVYQSHFWLEQGGYVIDITADQFDDCDQKVIVRKDRRWHRQFVGQTRLEQTAVLKLNEFLLKRYRVMIAHFDEA